MGPLEHSGELLSPPTFASSSRSVWRTREGVNCKRSAVRLKWSSSASATKTLSSRSSTADHIVTKAYAAPSGAPVGNRFRRGGVPFMRVGDVRRLIIGFVCVLAATAAAPQAATARPRVELRSMPPTGLRAGETWTADLFVHGTADELAAAGPPTILIHNHAAGWTEIRATPKPGEPGAYSAAVVFPDPGTWTYHVHDPIAGGGFDFEPISVGGTRTRRRAAPLGDPGPYACDPAAGCSRDDLAAASPRESIALDRIVKRRYALG